MLKDRGFSILSIVLILTLLIALGSFLFLRQNNIKQTADVNPSYKPNITSKPSMFSTTSSSSNSDVNSTKINLSTTTKYYSITGASEQEIRSQLDQLGPISESGRYDAKTDWFLKWDYPRQILDNKCSTGPITVSLDVTYTIPQIDQDYLLSPSLKKKWDIYLKNLILHEQEHKNIAVRQANALIEELNKVNTYPTCNELDVIVNGIGQNTVNKIREQNYQYDEETDHGGTQGAIFP